MLMGQGFLMQFLDMRCVLTETLVCDILFSWPLRKLGQHGREGYLNCHSNLHNFQNRHWVITNALKPIIIFAP